MSFPHAKPVIRSFRVVDQAAVRRLVLDGLGDHFQTIDESLNPDLEDIATHYVRQGHTFIVAEYANEIVGAGAMVELQDRTARIARVSVDKKHRRQGIAATIVSRLIEIARKRGYERLVVETNHDWFAAIELYRHCGFEAYALDSESVHLQLILERQ